MLLGFKQDALAKQWSATQQGLLVDSDSPFGWHRKSFRAQNLQFSYSGEVGVWKPGGRCVV